MIDWNVLLTIVIIVFWSLFWFSVGYQARMRSEKKAKEKT